MAAAWLERHSAVRKIRRMYNGISISQYCASAAAHLVAVLIDVRLCPFQDVFPGGPSLLLSLSSSCALFVGPFFVPFPLFEDGLWHCSCHFVVVATTRRERGRARRRWGLLQNEHFHFRLARNRTKIATNYCTAAIAEAHTQSERLTT